MNLADGNSVATSTTSHAGACFKFEKQTVADESAKNHPMWKIFDLK